MRKNCIKYNKKTGEACGFYEFDSWESMQHHLSLEQNPDMALAEITEKEECELAEFDNKKNAYKKKIDTEKAKKYLKDRKKEVFTVNEHGISYQDLRPESVTLKRGQK